MINIRSTGFKVFAFLALASGVYWVGHSGININTDLTESDASSSRLASCPDVDFNITRTLQVGSQGNDVRQLQTFLIAYYPGDTTWLKKERNLRTFGMVTSAQIKQYQTDHYIDTNPNNDAGDIAGAVVLNGVTYTDILGELRPVCNPHIDSIDPGEPKPGERVVITGRNFSVTQNMMVQLCRLGKCKNTTNLYARSSDGTTLIINAPQDTEGRVLFDVYVHPNNPHWNRSNHDRMTVVVGSQGSQDSKTCGAITTASACVKNTNPICEWYNGACKLPSCGGLSVFTGTNDPSKYRFSCGRNPGSAWSLLGATDDCGWTEGSTQYGCFYTSTTPGESPPPREPRRPINQQ